MPAGWHRRSCSASWRGTRPQWRLCSIRRVCRAGPGTDRRRMQRIRPLSYSDNRRVRFIASWLPSTTITRPPFRGASFCSCCRLRTIFSESGFPVGDVAELHQGRLAAGPPVARIDQAGRPGDRRARLDSRRGGRRRRRCAAAPRRRAVRAAASQGGAKSVPRIAETRPMAPPDQRRTTVASTAGNGNAVNQRLGKRRSTYG